MERLVPKITPVVCGNTNPDNESDEYDTILQIFSVRKITKSYKLFKNTTDYKILYVLNSNSDTMKAFKYFYDLTDVVACGKVISNEPRTQSKPHI